VAQGNAWVPMGEVRWEMGCSEDVIKKAKGDFRKRTDDTPEEAAKVTTFVFVSPRRWRGKAAWQEAAAKEGQWREVRAYNADDLEAWIETAPGVALWLGELLGLSGNGIESLERYWNAWSHQTRFPISKAAIFAGRDAEKDALSEALSKSPRLIAIQADSREEAVAFVCAHLLEHSLAERAACITAPEGWRFVDANSHLSIGLAATPEVAQQRAPKDGFTLIVPLSTGDKATYFSGAAASALETQHIVLERPRAEQFEAALCTMGEEVSDANRLARTTGRSWSVYRRLRAQNPAIRRPAWMSDPTSRSLVAVTLVGGWNGGRQGDRNCLESITQKPYDESEADLRHIAQLDDSPVLQIGSVWKAKAPLELLYLFGPEITAGELRRFFSVVEAVLAEPDPALELEESKRWMAAIYGKVRQESGLVIDAIADALAKLRVYAENSTDPNATTIMDGVDGVVFADRWIELPKERDYAEDHEELQRLRVCAVQQVFAEQGWGGLTSLAKQSGDPWVVGWAIATAEFSQQALLEWTIEEHKAGGCPYHNSLVSGVLHAVSSDHLADLLQKSANDFSRGEDFAAFLTCARCDRNTWNIVEHSENAVQNAYWRAIQPGYLKGNAEDVNYLVDNLIAIERPRTAFCSVAHDMKAIETSRLLALLNAIRIGAEPTGRLPNGWDIFATQSKYWSVQEMCLAAISHCLSLPISMLITTEKSPLKTSMRRC
jgi:hypothetical protein